MKSIHTFHWLQGTDSFVIVSYIAGQPILPGLVSLKYKPEAGSMAKLRNVLTGNKSAIYGMHSDPHLFQWGLVWV